MTAATVAVAASAIHQLPKPFAAGLVAHRLTATIATTSLDDIADIVELGYLPANCTVIGFQMSSTDMDSGTAAIVHKLTIGATDVATGLVEGQAGTAAYHAISPLDLTVTTKVQIAVTTVAATAVAGTIDVVVFYMNK